MEYSKLNNRFNSYRPEKQRYYEVSNSKFNANFLHEATNKLLLAQFIVISTITSLQIPLALELKSQTQQVQLNVKLIKQMTVPFSVIWQFENSLLLSSQISKLLLALQNCSLQNDFKNFKRSYSWFYLIRFLTL